MSQNVEIVRQAHEAFNRPDLGVFDLDAFYRLADPDLVVDWSRSNGLEARFREPTRGLEPRTPSLRVALSAARLALVSQISDWQPGGRPG